MRPLMQRHHLVDRMRANLERQGFPRLQMMLLVSLTGAVGFLVSYTLLGMGLTQMWLRYLLAFGFAYLAFLGLLWLWLRTRAEDYGDIPDVSDAFVPRGRGHACDGFQGGGGSGGGGGASGSFDAPALQPAAVDMADDGMSDALGAVGDAASGADELALPLMALLFVAALLLSSLWVVYSAPVLFAELLVDGVLAASLYRRLRGLESQHWLETALKRTAWPFVLTGLLLVAIGWGMQAYAPGAHSIGEVMRYVEVEGK